MSDINWFTFIFDMVNRFISFANTIWTLLNTSILNITFEIVNRLPSFIGSPLTLFFNILPSAFLNLKLIELLGGAGLGIIVALTIIKLVPVL